MNKAPAPAYKRRNYFINKGLQSRFIAGFTLAVFLGFVVNLLFVYFLIDRELTSELYKIHIKIRTTSEIAAPILWKLGAITIPSILIISALVGYYLTRGIELPLLNFKSVVNKTGQGDLTQSLPGDLPGELPEAFNAMTGSLEEKFRSLKKSADSLHEKFLMIDRQGPLSKKDLAGALEDISRARKNAWEQFSRFKV